MRSVSVPSESSVSEALKLAEMFKDGKMKDAIVELQEASSEYIKARDESSLEVAKLAKLKEEQNLFESSAQEKLEEAKAFLAKAEALQNEFDLKQKTLADEALKIREEFALRDKQLSEQKASYDNTVSQAQKIKSELEKDKAAFDSEKADIYAKVEKTFSIWGSK